MSTWGPNHDQPFTLASIPAAYTVDGTFDKFFFVEGKKNQLALFVNYTKGTEAGLEIKVQHLRSDSTVLFEESVVSALGVVSPFRYSKTSTGAHRILIPLASGTRAVKVSVRDTAGVGGDGTGLLIAGTEEG